MDLLQGYGEDGDSDEEGQVHDFAFGESSLDLPIVNLTPAVSAEVGVKKQKSDLFDPKTKELMRNVRYEELYQPAVGQAIPLKPANFNSFHFDRAIRSFDTLGYAQDPSANPKNQYIGDVQKAVESDGVSLFESKTTGGEKRKKAKNYDSTDLDNYTGPWAKYEDEETVSKPTPELQKEMDEIVRKRKLKSRAGRKAAQEEQHVMEESSTLHIKEDADYQGRSWMDAPKYTGTNLREDFCPERCYPPTKQAHTYSSHTKAVNAIRWFPKTAHLFLSCSMDNKVKLWEVYGSRKLVRTYNGHKMPVRDICFNNDGTEFLSTSFDKHVKLWDTETGAVKNRFHTGHKAYCVKFNPDDDKQTVFLAGMDNKKIIQWDTRTGEIEQEYDRHLGAVNSITFFDRNRRFCSTSDDKSLRIWEWGIPVDTKLIQNAGLHSIPTMTKSPTEKWIVGQSMDNRIVLFQLIDDKLRFAKKKAFRGHNVAGYSCSVDFSPDMSFLTSGDADGKVYIWDWRTHKIVSTWKAHDNVCISTLWHPHEAKRMISAGWDGAIKMCQMFLKSKGILLAEFSLCWKPYHMNMSRFAKGQFQWWKKPIYYRPVVSPLERGPDFTYLDGRKPTITSLSELKRRQHHVELGSKIRFSNMDFFFTQNYAKLDHKIPVDSKTKISNARPQILLEFLSKLPC
uniref:Pre-mRNA-processing factor 17 n=1 Tax=Ditylenchus dipsaci TaxID=166011 RepID=A0A915EDI7_9BILA